MQSQNNDQIDGWIFSGISGILTTPLGMALTNSMKSHTGLRVWGKTEENNGELNLLLIMKMSVEEINLLKTSTVCKKLITILSGLTVFKTQSWANFQKVNPGFIFTTPTNDLLSIQDALMSIEPCSIRIFIIDIRPPENFDRQGVVHTNTFIVIGDESATAYLVTIDLAPGTFLVEHSYDLSQIRRKMFNGMPILSTTINTHISSSVTVNKHIYICFFIISYLYSLFHLACNC